MFSPTTTTISFALLALPFCTAFWPYYNLAVSGQLNCNGTAMAGVQVKLFEDDRYADDDLGTDVTELDGKFAISTNDYEIPGPPDNYIKIVHRCTTKPPGPRICTATIRHPVPAAYTNGHYDLGTMELWRNPGNKVEGGILCDES
ncbi:unnamed protein product, partial [Mesorhabditis spiculigera]